MDQAVLSVVVGIFNLEIILNSNNSSNSSNSSNSRGLHSHRGNSIHNSPNSSNSPPQAFEELATEANRILGTRIKEVATIDQMKILHKIQIGHRVKDEEDPIGAEEDQEVKIIKG